MPNTHDFDSSHLQLSAIDMTHALSKNGGNAQMLLKIMGMFVQHHAQDLPLLDEALENKEFATAAKIVHTLAGIANFIGALDLEKKTQRFNQAFHAGEQQNFESLLNEVVISLPPVLADLNTVLISQGNAGS